MNLSDKRTYVVPTCQEILLAAGSGSGVLRVSGSTEDVDYEDL